jgi:PAS domain S-box-containing protein
MRRSTVSALHVLTQHVAAAVTMIQSGCGDATGLLGCLVASLTETLPAAQAAAREAEDLFEFAPVGYHEIDATGRIARVNRTELRMLGFSPEEMLGRFAWEFIAEPLDARQTMQATLAGAVTDGQPFERSYRCKQGELLPVLVGERILRDEQGQLRGIFATIQDLTERKRHLQQLEHVRRVGADLTRELDPDALLRLLAEQVQALFGEVGVAVYLWDKGRDGLAARALLPQDGYPRQRFLERGQGCAGQAAALGRGLIVNDYGQWAHAVPDPAGTVPGTLCAMAEPLRYREEILGAVLVTTASPRRQFSDEHRDVLGVLCQQATIALSNAELFSELNLSYEALTKAQAEQIRVEKLRALGQLSTGLAHDLNNVFAGILAQSQLIPLQMPRPELADMLQPITRSAVEGAKIVRRIQDFASQKSATVLIPCPLQAIVLEALDLTRPRWRDEAQRNGAHIEIHVDCQDLPDALGQPAEIREAIANLILNALDAMPEGGQLTIAGRAEAGAVLLRIQDTGGGIPPDVQPRIFEPFFSTKGTRGSGLGLSQVYGIMERHEGRVEVASAPGAGTTFTLRFRAAEASAPPASPDGARLAARYRILVVDDEPVVRQAIASLLRVTGQEVAEAEGGEAALAYLRTHACDLVLTDLGMPGMNGWRLAALVKQHDPALRVVLLTGWQEDPQSAEARAWVDAILAKPIRLEDLLQTIRGVMDGPPPGRPEATVKGMAATA